MDSVSLNYSDFFTKGFITGKFSEPLDEFYRFNFPDCNAEVIEEIQTEAKDLLDKLHVLVGERMISSLFPKYELRDCAIWEGVDDYSKLWHNDYVGGSNMNTSILVYLDDTAASSNIIEVKNENTQYTIIPNAGDFVWLNQTKPIFQHKATHNSGRRRVLSFEYFV